MTIRLRCEPGEQPAWVIFQDAQRRDALHLRFNFEKRAFIVARGLAGARTRIAKKRLTAYDGGALRFSVAALEGGAGRIDFGGHGAIDVEAGDLLGAARAVSGFGAWSLDGHIVGLGVEEGARLVRTSLEGVDRDDPWFGRDEPIVFDLGMHNGADTEFYLLKGFRVVAVEANPTLAASCAWRFRDEIAAGRLVVLAMGVGEAAGAIPFYVNTSLSEWSSFVKATASRGHDVAAVTVNVVAIGEIVEAFGAPYFMKVDIEGHDRMVAKALAALATKPAHVSVENGAPAMLADLVAAGYDRFKYVEQSAIRDLAAPEPAREGRTVAHRFEYGASGPFGEEAPGEWLDVAQAEAFARKLWVEQARPAEGLWFDLHARLDDAERLRGD